MSKPQRIRGIRETWVTVFSDAGWKDEDGKWHPSSPFSATEHQVALTLATFMSVNGDSCYPSIPRLAVGTGRSQSTIKTALDRLVELGFLDRRRNRGRGNSNEYVAVIPDYFVWDASAEENSRRAALFVSGHEQLLVGPVVTPVSAAPDRAPKKTAGDRPFSQDGPEEENSRWASLKQPVGVTKTAGDRPRINQDQSKDQTSSRSHTSQLLSSSVDAKAIDGRGSAAASQSEPWPLEVAVSQLHRLNGWDPGSLLVVEPLLFRVPGAVAQLVLEATLARADRRSEDVGYFVTKLRAKIGEWRQAQAEARLAVWDEYFGEKGLDEVKRTDPERYVLAYAKPELAGSRPIPPNLVVSHIWNYLHDFVPAADRLRLIRLFVHEIEEHTNAVAAVELGYGMVHDAILNALTVRPIRPYAEVRAELAVFCHDPERLAQLLAFADELHANTVAELGLDGLDAELRRGQAA